MTTTTTITRRSVLTGLAALPATVAPTLALAQPRTQLSIEDQVRVLRQHLEAYRPGCWNIVTDIPHGVVTILRHEVRQPDRFSLTREAAS